MIQVCRIGYAAFETPDLERQLAYYTGVLGLELIDRSREDATLACPLDERSVVLRRGDAARCTELGFHIPRADDLSAFAHQLAGHGVALERRRDAMPGVPDLVALHDLKGTAITVFNEPAARVPPARAVGVAPIALGHVAFNVPDVQATVAFYCDVLGFRFSDSIEDFFVWLRCNPNHHTVNFIRGARTKVHHIAFEVRDWNHLQLAADLLSQSGYKTLWGPGRHGCGHNIFSYHRDPDGHIVELFAELDQMREDLGYYEPRPWHRERPQVPKIWPDDPAASNLWGPMPSAGFLD